MNFAIFMTAIWMFFTPLVLFWEFIEFKVDYRINVF